MKKIKKINYKIILVMAGIMGLVISGATYLIEIEHRFGWPYDYYIDEPANCTGMICETALKQFHPGHFTVNTLIWTGIVLAGLLLIKIKKNK